MKVLKYTFENEQLGIVDGEIVTLDPELIPCHFSLTLKAAGLFEEEYGKPIINVLFKTDSSDEMSMGRFIRALASSMYFEIENGKIVQNEITKEHFQDLPIYGAVASDLYFVGQIIDCAMQCIDDQTTKSAKNNNLNEPKPKN